MTNEEGKHTGSSNILKTNLITKPDDITQEPVVCPPTARLYISNNGDTTEYPSSIGQYVLLQQPVDNSSAGENYNVPPKHKDTISGSNSRGGKQKFQNSWQSKSDNSLKRNTREKNDEQCCDFCCLCLANFCLHLQ